MKRRICDPAPVYSLKQIARELRATASGEAYYGNALYVAMDMPGLTDAERRLILRWLDGSQSGTDRFRLQDVAIKLHQAAA